MVYTNMIQASIMIVVALILLTSGYEHFSEGVRGFIGKLEALDTRLTSSLFFSSRLYLRDCTLGLNFPTSPFREKSWPWTASFRPMWCRSFL